MSPYVDGGTYYPGFNVSGFFGSPEQWNVSREEDRWHHRLSYSKLVGTHMLKTGAEYNRVQWYYEHGVTNIGFAAAQTADALNLATTDSPLASFLLAIPDSATRRDIRETTPWWGGVIGFYVQHSWKTTPRLTINMGLRYDRTFIPTAGTDKDNNNYCGNRDYNRGVYVIQRMAPPCSVAKRPPLHSGAGGSPGKLASAARGGGSQRQDLPGHYQKFSTSPWSGISLGFQNCFARFLGHLL